MNPKMTDWFDKYLLNQMSDEEKREFLQALDNDELLKNDFLNYQNLINSFNEYHERNELENKFNEWYLEENLSSKGARNKAWWSVFYIAASIALIITFLGIWVYDTLKSETKRHSQELTYLKKEIKQIQNQQNTIVRNFQKIQQQKYAPANSQSTGFLISSKYIITTYHSIQNADSIFVENDYCSRSEAKVAYANKFLDVVLLYVPTLSISTNNIHLINGQVELGNSVFTLGFPTSQLVYNEGYISALNGYEDDSAYYQITLPLNPGNSGGPLFDIKGNLIGVVVSKNTSMEGVAFALKSNMLYALKDSLSADSLKNIWLNAFNEKSFHYNSKNTMIQKFKPMVFKIFVYQNEKM